MTIDEKALTAAIEALEPKCRPITGGANPLARRLAEEFAQAALEAYESAKQKDAEGWVLVPEEPTDEHIRAMLAVGEPATFRHHLRHPNNGPSMTRATELKIERARAMYRALLSAGGEGG